MDLDLPSNSLPAARQGNLTLYSDVRACWVVLTAMGAF